MSARTFGAILIAGAVAWTAVVVAVVVAVTA